MSITYKDRKFLSGKVIYTRAKSKKKRKKNAFLLLSSLYKMYKTYISRKKCYTLDLSKIIKSNSILIYKQLKCNEYLLGSNKILLLNPRGMSLPHQFIFDLSKKIDCIKLYMNIRPEFTESDTLVDDDLQNVFKELHKKVLQHNKADFKRKGILKDNGEGKQYAWAVLKGDDGLIHHFKVQFPCKEGGKNCQKLDSAKTKHCEDFLIRDIIEKVEKNTKFKYTELFIYSFNSPCLGRKGQDPCMIQLTDMSNYLSKNYNNKTYIGFNKFYVSGDLKPEFPYLSFCHYKIPININKQLKSQANNKQDKYNESEKQKLRDIYLSFDKKVSVNGNKNQVRHLLHKITKKDCTRMRKFIAKMILKDETFSVEKATLSEVKQIGLTKPKEIFGKKRVSQDHYNTILWFWEHTVDKEFNNDMFLTLNEDIQRTLVKFWIESTKSVKHHPTIVHVNF